MFIVPVNDLRPSRSLGLRLGSLRDWLHDFDFGLPAAYPYLLGPGPLRIAKPPREALSAMLMP